MSVKVDLAELAGALAHYGFAYVITVGDDYRAHTVAVDPRLIESTFDIADVGNTTRRNVGAHQDVTLVWPPRDPGGYTLIVDGRGQLTGDGLTVAPVRAVLHRPAHPNSPNASGCGDDCVPLTTD